MKHYNKTQSIPALNHMIDEVMNAHFLCPVMMDIKETPDENGIITLKESTTIQFSMITNAPHEAFFLAFKDWQELRLAGTEQMAEYRTTKNRCDAVYRLCGFGIA